MIRNIDGATESFLGDLARIHDGIARATREITSGLRVEKPSDDPFSVGDILQLRGSIAWNDQVLANLEAMRAEVESAEAGLAQAVQLIDQATTCASQGAGSTVTAQQRQILAEQVRGILEQLVGVSRTASGGRFVFSGDLGNAPMYELNLQSANGVRQLTTPSSTQQVIDADGSTLPVTRTAQEIFDAPQMGVFAVVNALRLALENNNEANIQGAVESLRSAGEALNDQLSHYGSLQDRVRSAIDRAHKIGLSRQTELSDRSDADLTAATLALNQGQLQEQAALSARARGAVASLFDYLR
jgi:flagellar hook-associated protein 3 FlgL